MSKNVKNSYTLINLSAMKAMGIDPMLYCIASLINNLAFNPVNKTGWCFASKQAIAEEIGISRRQIIRHINTLETMGLIERDNKNNRLYGETGRIRTTTLWFDHTDSSGSMNIMSKNKKNEMEHSDENDTTYGDENDTREVTEVSYNNNNYNNITPPTPPTEGREVAHLAGPGSRAEGTNPRALGINPRALGVNSKSTVKKSSFQNPIGQDEPFDSDEYVEKMASQDKNYQQAIIGSYFILKDMVFPTKRAAELEIKRCVRAASRLMDYSGQRVQKAMELLASDPFWAGKWTLDTVVNKINQIK